MSESDEQDRLMLRPEGRDPLQGILGFLRHWAKDQPVTVEEMKADVRAKAAEKYGRPIASRTVE